MKPLPPVTRAVLVRVGQPYFVRGGVVAPQGLQVAGDQLVTLPLGPFAGYARQVLGPLDEATAASAGQDSFRPAGRGESAQQGAA